MDWNLPLNDLLYDLYVTDHIPGSSPPPVDADQPNIPEPCAPGKDLQPDAAAPLLAAAAEAFLKLPHLARGFVLDGLDASLAPFHQILEALGLAWGLSPPSPSDADKESPDNGSDGTNEVAIAAQEAV